MSDIRAARTALLSRILKGSGASSHEQRRAAFDNGVPAGPIETLVNKVAMNAFRITGDDFTAAKQSGFNEDQLFEIVVCAAVGQANRQYDAALLALDAATGGGEYAPFNT